MASRNGRLEVRAVESAADERAFIALPYRLYRDDPYWVPPLRIEERRRWSPRRNPSLRGRWVRRFVARRSGRTVGRIAAVVDGEFRARWDPGAGFFGFFEVADDPGAAGALLDTAEAALRTQGCSAALGPINLSTHDEVGLLVDGFDSAPTLLSPYNPRRYQAVVEASGYAAARDYHGFLWTPDQRPAAALSRLASRLARRAGDAGRLTIRGSTPERWARDVRTLYQLYNAAFADLWGFVSISWDEFLDRAGTFRRFYRPELALFAELDGVPVGFALVLPDVNAALAGVGGRLLPLGWLHLARAVPRLRTGRYILTGVLPAVAGEGIGALLALRMADAGRAAGLQRVELSLVQDGNGPMTHIIEAFGCPRVKTWRLYAKQL